MKSIKDTMRRSVWSYGELGDCMREHSREHISNDVRVHVRFTFNDSLVIRWSLLRFPAVIADKLEEFVCEQN